MLDEQTTRTRTRGADPLDQRLASDHYLATQTSIRGTVTRVSVQKMHSSSALLLHLARIPSPLYITYEIICDSKTTCPERG